MNWIKRTSGVRPVNDPCREILPLGDGGSVPWCVMDEGEVVAGAVLGLLVVRARASDPVVRDLLGDAVAAMVEARDRILAAQSVPVKA